MSLLSQFLLRIVLMIVALGIIAVPVFLLFRWNIETYRSSVLSALIAGAVIGISALIYRLVVHPVAVQVDAQWKARSASRDG